MVRRTADDWWALLQAVPDPEIPVLNVVEMGIVREVVVEDQRLLIRITPTYMGCPAMDAIADDIRERLAAPAAEEMLTTDVELVYAPAWTTDWILPSAHAKMREHGIAPPEQASADRAFLTGEGKVIPCPRCGSRDTKMVSAFGSTACKAHFTCTACLEPFEHFKCI